MFLCQKKHVTAVVNIIVVHLKILSHLHWYSSCHFSRTQMFIWPGAAHAPGFLATSLPLLVGYKNNFTAKFSESFYALQDGWNEFPEPNFLGFGVPPFGVVDIWWVEITKSIRSLYYALHWYHWFVGKLIPVGCVQHTRNSSIFLALALPTFQKSFRKAEFTTKRHLRVFHESMAIHCL